MPVWDRKVTGCSTASFPQSRGLVTSRDYLLPSNRYPYLEVRKKYYAYSSKRSLAGTCHTGQQLGGVPSHTGRACATDRHRTRSRGPKVSFMARVDSHSTKQTLEIAHDDVAAGANYLLVLPPAYFGKATNMAVVKCFFADIARKNPLPVLTYNFPGMCNGVDIDSETITDIVRDRRPQARVGSECRRH